MSVKDVVVDEVMVVGVMLDVGVVIVAVVVSQLSMGHSV